LFGPAYTARLSADAPRRRGRARSHRVHLAVAGATVTALTVAMMLLSAAPAQAKLPIVGEIPVVGEVVEGIGSVGEAVLNPAEAVLKGFLHLLQAIFGGFEAHIITEVIAGLLAIPNFNSGHVAGLEHTTVAIAAGMLSAVLTLSILRYYLAGLTDSGSGGFEALQGVVRVVGAVGFIILWPGIFNEVVAIPSAFNHALLGSSSVQHNVALLFDAALTIGSGAFAVNAGIGLIFVILIGLISAVVFLSLLWMKVLLSVMMMFLYVSMPLAVVLWPIPELSWLASSAMKALAVAVIVPSVWAILFSLSAAVNADVLTFAPSHSIVDTVIIRPLAGITLMLLCITIPRFLMRTALIGPHGQPGGWRVWRTVTFGMFAARAAAGGARSVATAAVEGHPKAARMIDSLPSPIKPPSEPGSGSFAGRMVFGRSGFPEELKGKGSPGSSGNQKDQDSGGPKPDREAKQQEAQTAQARTQAGADGAKAAFSRQEAGFSVPGIERPPFDRQVADQAWQSMQSGARLAPPAAKDVKAAMAEFPAETQRGLAAFHSASPGRMRQFAAQHVGSPSLSGGQRDALLTLGSAPRSELKAGMSQAIKALDASEAAAAPPSTPTSGASADPPAPSTSAETPSGATRVSQPSPGTSSGPTPAPSTPASSSPTPSPASPPPPSLPTTAPSESGSLGMDVRDQPPSGGSGSTGKPGGLVDPEPFRE
jgi:hypothetical protein